ncbi:hypothetical protein BC828DRAFT_383301 [Blastocladiella britannica]|nr:hypothetical protein BC828DRAFT_383301 [Blastocladiella britannica]
MPASSSSPLHPPSPAAPMAPATARTPSPSMIPRPVSMGNPSSRPSSIPRPSTLARAGAPLPPLPPMPPAPTSSTPPPPPSDASKKNRRVSTMPELLSNPPAGGASADAFASMLAKFPGMRESPAIVALLERASATARSQSAAAAKRQSVFALSQQRLVKDSTAYFEGEIAAELAALENSKDWFDIQKYVESYFGITLVAASASGSGSGSNGASLGFLPPPMPPMPKAPTATIPTPPVSRPRTPPASAPIHRPTTPTAAGSAILRPTTPTSAGMPQRPTTPSGERSGGVGAPAGPPPGVVPSTVTRCIALLPPIAAAWEQPLGKEYLQLAAPVNEWLYHAKQLPKPKDGQEEEVNGMPDLALIMAILSEMEGIDAATGELSEEDLDGWQAQIEDLVLVKARAHLTRLAASAKATWAAAQFGRARNDLYAAAVKVATAATGIVSLADAPKRASQAESDAAPLPAAVASGMLLAALFNACIQAHAARLADLGLPPLDPQVPPLAVSENVTRSPSPTKGGAAASSSVRAPSLASMMRTWLAVSAAMQRYLSVDLNAWGVRAVPVAQGRDPDSARIALILLAARFTQLSPAAASGGGVTAEDVTALAEALAVLRPDLRPVWDLSLTALSSGGAAVPSDTASRVHVNATGSLFAVAGPTDAASSAHDAGAGDEGVSAGAESVLVYEASLAKQTVAAATRMGGTIARVLRSSDVKGARAVWYASRYAAVLGILSAKHESSYAEPSSLARIAAIEPHAVAGLPRVPLDLTPRDWMPVAPCVYFILDSFGGVPVSPLETYLLRAHTYRKALHMEISVDDSSADDDDGPVRVDRDRAYDVNRLLLQIFLTITSTLVNLHETHGMAHGSVSAAHVLVLGTPEDHLIHGNADVRVLPPSLSIEPPPGYQPGVNAGYDSTLAADVKDLGELFYTIMDRFWYVHFYIYATKQTFTKCLNRYARPLVDAKPEMPTLPGIDRRPTPEADDSAIGSAPPMTPSVQLMHMRASTASLASGSENSTESPSRPSSAATMSRSSTVGLPSHMSLTPTSATFGVSGTLERPQTTTKRKKRPITIHLAPSIHPPWSPLYNEAASAVITRPDTPEPVAAPVPAYGGDKSLPPMPPMPFGMDLGGNGSVEMPARPKTPAAIRALAANDQDRAMNEIHQSLVGLVARMRAKDEMMRPVIREVLEHF